MRRGLVECLVEMCVKNSMGLRGKGEVGKAKKRREEVEEVWRKCWIACLGYGFCFLLFFVKGNRRKERDEVSRSVVCCYDLKKLVGIVCFLFG